MYHPGDLIELKLDSVAFGGEAVGRVDGLVMFVKGALDGEKVLAEVFEIKKNFVRARLKEVLEPSPHRIEPVCPIYGQCGGCQYQHVEYSYQLKLKEAQVRETLERIGGLKDFQMEPIQPSPHPLHYRSRVDFHVDRKRESIGFIGVEGRNIVDTVECAISTPAINQAYQEMRDEIRQDIERLPEWVDFIKFWDVSGQVHSVFLGARGEVDLRGREFLMHQVCGRQFKIPLLSFFQVNLSMLDDLVQCVGRFLDLKESDVLLDGFCGVGLFAVSLASQAKQCMGVEADRTAIQYARMNAEENNISNCKFLDKSVEKALKHPERYLEDVPNKVVLDPTRAGCEESMLRSLAEMQVKRIVYVSCNPATLARDLAYLSRNGYHLENVKPFDLFPQTKHCEVIANLTLLPSEPIHSR